MSGEFGVLEEKKWMRFRLTLEIFPSPTGEFSKPKVDKLML